MIHFIRFVIVLCLAYTVGWSQCVTTKDANGQIITTCDVYESASATSSSHKQVVYLGPPYLTFPTWLKGTIQLDQGGPVMACKLAYNLVTNTIQCQFDSSLTVSNVTPYAFTIHGMTFTRQMNSVLGVDYQLYTNQLNTGQTTLAKRISSQLIIGSIDNKYVKSSPFQGSYQPAITYYIRKGDAKPALTDLSRKSILAILYEQAQAIAPRLPKRSLTPQELLSVLDEYDSLLAIASRHHPPLSTDPVFRQALHTLIKYPNQAWRESVYGRVYIGFEVTEDGQVANVNTLSPENVGFGLDETVKQALKKMDRLNPDYKGRYCLPVAYSYTNRLEKKGAHLPIMVLPGERVEQRTLLAELVVPVQVARPVSSVREVWGYYP